ncbi:toxin-antitoxin system YwqK family antitoxin [Emticicia fontis]
MTNIKEYLTNVLKENNINNYSLAVWLLTVSKDLLRIELAIKECESHLLNRFEKTETYLRQAGLISYEGYDINIIDNTLVRIEFFYGVDGPEIDFCEVPLFMYKALLEDYYLSIKPSNFYDNGQIRVKGQSYNYLRQGVWVEYYSNGQILSNGEYKNSCKIGTWQYYYENGALKAIEYYDGNNYREGHWETWFENGQLQSSHFFKRGQIVGDGKFWYESGQISRFTPYSEERAFADGEYKEWYENGNLKTVMVVKDGKSIQYRYYDAEGNLTKVTDQ